MKTKIDASAVKWPATKQATAIGIRKNGSSLHGA